jgi:protein-L-isoaspartate(D-aspartate) O-methyltransferase
MTRTRKAILAAGLLAVGLGWVAADEESKWQRQRQRLVRETMEKPRDPRPPVRDPRVLDAMRQAPRHKFVPAAYRGQAYEDHPVPIGYGQTISQPYIVAVMTELLGPRPDHRVLELGTGSGYQAAVLSPLVKEVYTIEIVEPLGRAAHERLAGLGYANVEVKVGDGYFGWPEKAPFDAIIVTAWASHVPPPLLEQLKPGGRMVIPVGNALYQQNLVVVHKGETAQDLRMESIMPVVFVPLTGGHDRQEK